MRKAIFVTLLIVLTTYPVSADEYDYDINFEGQGIFGGNHTFTDNSTAKVNGNYTVQDNTKFTIEEGSTLQVWGDLRAIEPPQLNIDTVANVTVPIGFLAPQGTMRIVFAETILFNITVEVDNNTSIVRNVSQFDRQIGMDSENITVNISHFGFQQIAIAEIILSPEGDTPVTRAPDELSGNGTSFVIPTKNKVWTIDVYGELYVEGEIYGAEINCYGTCIFENAELFSTGPINVYGTASFNQSFLSGGVSDEDVIVWDDAEITWEETNGTGGTTDNWIRVLSTRTIGVQNSHVTFYGYGMGYDGIDTSPITDNSTGNFQNYGDGIIEIALDERERLIEWQDGNGDYHSEQASGKVVLATPWGTYEKDIAELPKTNHFDIEIDLPMLKFDSLVESSDTNNINSRLGVMATISNEGSQPATFLVDCYSNGTEANVGVNVPYTAEAGETIEIPMNWDSANEGVFTLDCEIFVPYHFDGIDVGGGQTVSTEEVTWNPEDEDGGVNLIIPIAIGVVIAAIIFTLITINNRLVEKAVVTNELETEDEEPEKEYLDDDEDLGTIE